MKKNIFKALALGFALILGATSCSNWLDVNNDPDNPNSSSAVVENRLPWIQRGFMYHAGVTNMRSASIAGVYHSTNGNVGNSACAWDMRAGLTTTPYQAFFCMCGNNLADLENKAQENGSTHYIAAAKVVRALAFMNLLDLYGEMPMSHAFKNEPTPAYDNGKQIYEQCMKELDEAIALFSEPQKEGATPLSRGDMWCNGDAQQWIKLCHGLKARYMMHTTKRADWNADAVLAETDKALASAADNAVQKCFNVAGEVTDWLMGDPIQTNGNWDYAGYGNQQRIGKFFYDKLVNARGAGVVDPRFTKIVPACMDNIVLDAEGKVSSYTWLRSLPVDVYDDATNRLHAGVTSIQLVAYADADKISEYKEADGADAAFVEARKAEGHTVEVADGVVKVTYKAGSHFINSSNPRYAEDWKYVSVISASTSTGTKLGGAPQDEKDLNYYAQKASPARAAGAVASTGSFQIRAISDFEIMCYEEICFIKAECYMRKGDKAQAHTWYLNGIRANIDRMQNKLIEWQVAGYADVNPDMAPMDDAAIEAYMSSAAVAQSAGDLKMADIMEQKYIAMGCHIENWNDLRRFNYSAPGDFGVVYPGIHKPAMFTGVAITGASETDPMAWPRRFRLPATLELQYNAPMALAVNAHALDENIWCYPVWWDCTSDTEYENYCK